MASSSSSTSSSSHNNVIARIPQQQQQQQYDLTEEEEEEEEEEYFWFWYGDDGEWKPFDNTIMNQLEEARKHNITSIRVQLIRGSNPNQQQQHHHQQQHEYEIHLIRLEQMNVITGHVRPITKVTALWYYETKDNNNSSSIATATTTAAAAVAAANNSNQQQQLQQQQQHWQRYNYNDSLLLALHDASPFETSVYIVRDNNNTIYYIDLINMIQKNVAIDSDICKVHKGILLMNNNMQNSGQTNNNNNYNNIQDNSITAGPLAAVPSSLPRQSSLGSSTTISSNGSNNDASGADTAVSAASAPATVFRTPSNVPVASTSSNNNIVSDADDSETSSNDRDMHDDDDDNSDHSYHYKNRPSYIPICPLSKKIMKDPVQTFVGSTYERKYITKYLKRHNHDPKTGILLTDKTLRENRGVRDTIEEWKDGLMAQEHKEYHHSRHSSGGTSKRHSLGGHSTTSSISSATRQQQHQQQQLLRREPMDGESVSSAYSAYSSSISKSRNEAFPQHEQYPSKDRPTVPFTKDYIRSNSIQDTMKVVCLGLSRTGSELAFRNPKDAQGKLGVNRWIWSLRGAGAGAGGGRYSVSDDVGVHCNVYSFYGQNVHHATQKLFFSSGTIYVIVWDMGATNPCTFENQNNISSNKNKNSSNGSSKCRAIDTQAALERDVCEKVQFWVDAIQQQEPDAVIVPVASLDGSFGDTQPKKYQQLGEEEVHRRCLFLKRYFDQLSRERGNGGTYANLIFGSEEDPVIRVDGAPDAADGLESLKSLVLQLSDESSYFPCMRRPLTSMQQDVDGAIQKLMVQGVRIIELHKFFDEIDDGFVDEDAVRSALRYMSDSGEVLYYGQTEERVRAVDAVSTNFFQTSGCLTIQLCLRSLQDDALGNFVVLDPNWVVSALACILRPDIHSAIRIMKRKQGGGQTVPEEAQAYYGPVASENDIRALWRAMLFADGSIDMDIKSEGDKLLDFLQLLFLRTGIIVSLDAESGIIISSLGYYNLSSTFPEDKDTSLNYCSPDSKLFFFPGLLRPGEHGKFVGIYNNSIFSKTMLAQAVQFHRMVSPVLLERICATVLSQVYARVNNAKEADGQEGTIYVKDILCWRTLLCFKLGLFTRTSHGDVQPSFVDVYAHLVDSCSDLCVGASYMGGAKQSLIISAKGEGGNEGEVIWKGGYDFITEAIRQVLEATHGVDFERRFFCPSCLAKENIRETRGWNECVLQRALEEGEDVLICEEGHSEKTQLLLGPSAPNDVTEKLFPSAVLQDVHADVLMPGVVMVGLYDERNPSEKIRKVGSGFVVDAEQGLIVTAAHTLMKLWGMEDYGRDFDGIEGAKAVIGVIPGKDSDEAYPPAVFRYFASIYKKDASLEYCECHVDACVLQITSRFENDVDGNGDFCGDEISVSLTGKSLLMKEQGLKQLDITEESHLGEPIRILGFDQPDNQKVNRSFGLSAGFVYKQFETQAVGGERYRYMPRKKTVLICPTIGGHSGGPCVNQKGEVIGILSCADFTEKSRSYLVPTSEWIHLLPKKKKKKSGSSTSTTATTASSTSSSQSSEDSKKPAARPSSNRAQP